MKYLRSRSTRTHLQVALMLACGGFLSACASSTYVKPNVVITPNSARTAGTIEVIAGLSKSEKYMKDLALLSAPAMQSVLECSSGKAAQSWLNGGAPTVLEDRPEAHSVTLQLKCVE